MRLLCIHLFAFLILIFSLPSFGLELEYYGLKNEVDAQSFTEDPQFRKKLFNRLKADHRPLPYKEAREVMFGDLFLKRDSEGYYIVCVYCEYKYSAREIPTGAPAPGKIPNPEYLNTEHTWPQSRFSRRHPEGTQKSDLHALFPATPKANSSRSNEEFGEVQGRYSQPCALSKRGSSVFEPADRHKGNVARALFYFAVRYELKISPAEEHYLRLWHLEDPVDPEELDRNDRIYQVQGSRNPFVDHPEWVEAIEDF